MTRTVHIALGSNLASGAGDRLATIAEALRRLEADGQVRVVAVSHVYETDPVPAGQPMYLNAAAALSTGLGTDELLARAQSVERSLGRIRREGERWGPRTIDIDLLMDGESVVSNAGPRGGPLTLPHPRMMERAFVLVPLAEIAADARIPPGALTVRSLVDRLDAGAIAGVRRIAPIPRD